MCGRYSSNLREVRALEREFEIRAIRLIPRFNCAPRQYLPVIVRRPDASYAVENYRWGLLPPWAKDAIDGDSRAVNARAETVATKPTFRNAFRKRRCLVIASGYYEWLNLPAPSKSARKTTVKQPVYIALDDPSAPMLFAGLWETWQPPNADNDPVTTFTVCTTEPSPKAAEVHDRMPALLPPENWKRWLDPATPSDELQSMLVPSRQPLHHYWVTPRMSSWTFEDPSAIAPWKPDAPVQGELSLG